VLQGGKEKVVAMNFSYFFVTTAATIMLLCSSLISGLRGASTTIRRTPAQISSAEKADPLQLTTSIVAQRYCKNPDSDVTDSIQITLRLRYTNTGSRPLILYKHENTIFRQMISRDLLDAAARRYVWDLSLTVVTGGGGAKIDGQVPSDLFVILRPKQSFEAEEETTVLVRRGDTGGESDGLQAGQYVLQVSVSTWPESDSVAETLRNRWRDIGVLWSSNITSSPKPFKIERNRRLENCSSESRK
jgi:hypothetical protein